VTLVPVLLLPYTPLVLDQTVKNMCLWLRNQGGPSANEATLTYSVVRNDGGKCKGCCTGVTVPAGQPYAGEKTSCDEAPFARTYEALNSGATLACVDRYENGFQGFWFGSWLVYTRATIPGFGNGSKFIVRVTGINCATVNPSDLLGCGGTPLSAAPTPRLLLKRDNGTETQVIPASVANSTSNLVIAPLGDLDVGIYSMAARIEGPVTNVMLWDNMGDPVGNVTTDDVTSGSTFQFNISTYAIGVSLLIETNQTTANVTWNVQPSSKASADKVAEHPFSLLMAVCVVASILFM